MNLRVAYGDMDTDDGQSNASNSNCSSNIVNVNQYDYMFGKHMENYNVETSAVHRKLQSKVEALRILRQELEQFRVERDQYKLMAETLQLRYSAMKRNSELLAGNGNACGALSQNSSLAALLHETRELNLKLNTEVEALKQRLNELQGDMELLRERECNSKSRLQTLLNENAAHNKEELQWKRERANFICHLENLKKKNAQLAYDLKGIIDEKEELITERDAYKCKAHRLNHELLVALKANKMHPKLLDIDGVLLENKYLHERVKIQESELELTKQSVNKYKNMVEAKRKKGIVKLGGSANDETILSPRQVKTILESGIDLPGKTETIHDLKSLCLALLDNLNDKNLALTHQKRTNNLFLEYSLPKWRSWSSVGSSYLAATPKIRHWRMWRRRRRRSWAMHRRSYYSMATVQPWSMMWVPTRWKQQQSNQPKRQTHLYPSHAMRERRVC
ncbi:coiled-coil domain-containing protein 149 isoform X2 [Drosophila mojavensis]|uniref:Uncharacterized protein, isoform B n=1 Tax=Drosophila mojavensis TaxID=7230 RepID=A0A0Q9WZ33_DROMO|nr:coiled-coil domain-containing protein 149 isoform X2 [Drosophila mojavensis]KRG01053.1 uncharacterized protein Dmoj_GI24308, isoform B [Drosophila mojavensis]